MSPKEQLSWVDGVKVLALLGVLLNHLIEAFTTYSGFGSFTWLTNPSRSWPSLQERLAHLWPAPTELFPSWIQALGWIGDAGPGVFILLSGFGLCYGLLSTDTANKALNTWTDFLLRRLGRIHPTYCVAVLAYVSVWPFWSAAQLSMEGWLGFSMLTGIRPTPETFMFWNRSWWFVWTIIQLYLFFPLLWIFARRFGFGAMFAVALIITLASRTWGLLYVDHLYYWMTGLFAGTRLAEFALGMVLAKLYFSKQLVIGEANHTRLLVISLLIYSGGLVSSVFLPSTIVSNLLTSAGLTGVFVFLWVAVISRFSTRLTRILLWMAPVSYVVFLIHQPAMQFIEMVVQNKTVALAMSGAWLVASFFFAKLLVWLLDRPHQLLHSDTRIKASLGFLLVLASVAGLLLLPILEPYLIDHPYRPVLTWAMSIFVLAILYFEFTFASPGIASVIRRWTLLACCLVLWILPPGSGAIAVALSALLYFGWKLIATMAQSTASRAALAGTAAVLVTVPILLLESHYRSLPGQYDTDSWGELPAMTLHPTRGYGLKENTTVELDYVYQYTMQTNESGLQGRPITPRKKGSNSFRIAVLGDAFSMPEVVEYKRSYTAILERILNDCVADRPVEVFNLGVTGYSPTEKWPQARELLPTIEPDLVVDQMFPIELFWMREETNDRLKQIGLLPSEKNDYRSFFTSQQTYQHLLREFADLTELVSTVPSIFRRSHALSGMFDSNSIDSPETIELLAKYWTGVRHLVEDQLDGELVAAYTPAAVEISDLNRLNYLPRYFSLSPDRSELSRPFNAMQKAADTAGIKLLDWRALLKLAEPNSSGIYSPDFWHWTETGHAIAANSLVSMLVEQKLVPASCQNTAPENSAQLPNGPKQRPKVGDLSANR